MSPRQKPVSHFFVCIEADLSGLECIKGDHENSSSDARNSGFLTSQLMIMTMIMRMSLNFGSLPDTRNSG